jgi:hypothetical protein
MEILVMSINRQELPKTQMLMVDQILRLLTSNNRMLIFRVALEIRFQEQYLTILPEETPTVIIKELSPVFLDPKREIMESIQ